MSEVVKRKARKLEGVHKAPQGNRKRSWLPVGEDPGLGVHRSRRPLKQFAQCVGHWDGTAVAILGFRKTDGTRAHVHVDPAATLFEVELFWVVPEQRSCRRARCSSSRLTEGSALLAWRPLQEPVDDRGGIRRRTGLLT